MDGVLIWKTLKRWIRIGYLEKKPKYLNTTNCQHFAISSLMSNRPGLHPRKFNLFSGYSCSRNRIKRAKIHKETLIIQLTFLVRRIRHVDLLSQNPLLWFWTMVMFFACGNRKRIFYYPHTSCCWNFQSAKFFLIFPFLFCLWCPSSFGFEVSSWALQPLRGFGENVRPKSAYFCQKWVIGLWPWLNVLCCYLRMFELWVHSSHW